MKGMELDFSSIIYAAGELNKGSMNNTPEYVVKAFERILCRLKKEPNSVGSPDYWAKLCADFEDVGKHFKDIKVTSKESAKIKDDAIKRLCRYIAFARNMQKVLERTNKNGNLPAGMAEMKAAFGEFDRIVDEEIELLEARKGEVNSMPGFVDRKLVYATLDLLDEMVDDLKTMKKAQHGTPLKDILKKCESLLKNKLVERLPFAKSIKNILPELFKSFDNMDDATRIFVRIGAISIVLTFLVMAVVGNAPLEMMAHLVQSNPLYLISIPAAVMLVLSAVVWATPDSISKSICDGIYK